jgi:hypothetical protein
LASGKAGSLGIEEKPRPGGLGLRPGIYQLSSSFGLAFWRAIDLHNNFTFNFLERFLENVLLENTDSYFLLYPDKHSSYSFSLK